MNEKSTYRVTVETPVECGQYFVIASSFDEAAKRAIDTENGVDETGSLKCGGVSRVERIGPADMVLLPIEHEQQK